MDTFSERTMFEHELLVSKFQLNYAHELLKDIPEEQFTLQPLPGVHHPAWIVGHLAFVFDQLPRMLGHAGELPESYRSLFGPGSVPQADPALYPSKQELVAALERGHQRAAKVIAETPPEVFARPNPTGMKQLAFFPTVGHVVSLLLTGHEATHLGQLSFWRRAVGLPALF